MGVDSGRGNTVFRSVNGCGIRLVVDQQQGCADLSIVAGVVSLEPAVQVPEDVSVLLEHDENRLLKGVEPESELVHEALAEVA